MVTRLIDRYGNVEEPEYLFSFISGHFAFRESPYLYTTVHIFFIILFYLFKKKIERQNTGNAEKARTIMLKRPEIVAFDQFNTSFH